MTPVLGSSAQVLNQVVSRNVCLVTDGNEAGDPDAETPGVIEDRQAERPALRRHGHVAGWRIDRREGRVQPDRRTGIQQAHAVGTDQPASRLPHAFEQQALADMSFGVAFAEAGADDADRANPLRETVVDGRLDLRGRDDDDGEVDGIGDVGDAWIGPQSFDLTGRRVHRRNGSAESCRHQIVENLGADFPPFAIGADHRDPAGFEERLHRGRGRRLRPRGGLRLECGRDRQRQRHLKDAALVHGGHGEARVAEHVEHAAVAGEDVGVERSDPLLAGQARQVFQQPGAYPMPLQRIGDRECDLRTVAMRGIAIETGEGHNPPARLGGDRRASWIVDEGPDAIASERADPQKPEVETLAGQRQQKLPERVDILDRYLAHADGRTVPEDDISCRNVVEHGRLAGNARAPRSARTSRCGSGSGRDSIRGAHRRASDSRRSV